MKKISIDFDYARQLIKTELLEYLFRMPLKDVDRQIFGVHASPLADLIALELLDSTEQGEEVQAAQS